MSDRKLLLSVVRKMVGGNPLEDIDVLTDPDKNFRIIMKDSVIYKNAL